jgi:hypothetical protein
MILINFFRDDFWHGRRKRGWHEVASMKNVLHDHETSNKGENMNLNRIFQFIGPLMVAMGSASAFAQVPVDQIRLGTPTYQGTGCPFGSVSAQLSPDARSLSLLFGQFQAEAGGMSGKTVDRKACNVAIPVNVPIGFSVSVIKIDYRGYHRLPLNASSTFDVEYFFAGQGGPAYHKNFVGATDGNFTLNNTLIATSSVWSPCGEDVNLRTNTSIAVQSNVMNEQAIMTLDSADISSGVVYQLQWRSCSPGGYTGGGGGYGGSGGGSSGYPYPGSLGPCVINSYYDQRGFQVYMVKDGTGRILGNTVQYAEALRLAQQSQSMGFCSGVVNNTQPNGGGYPGNGGYGGSCQIMPGGNAMGQRFYRVVDRSGRILFNTPDYNQAMQFSQTNPVCR